MYKKIFVLSIALTGLSSAQGLFDVAPALRSLSGDNSGPKFLVGAHVAYDDDIFATDGGDDSVDIGASIAMTGSGSRNRSDFNYSLRYGANYRLTSGETESDQFSSNIAATLGYGHRINSKLTFSTRAHINYGLEPNYLYGIANSRTQSETLSWSGDVSFGYTVNRNFGLYGGVSYAGVEQNDDDNRDGGRRTYTPYIQARYRLNNSTYLTGGYRFSYSENLRFRDSISHILTVGVEHKINEKTSVTLRGGAQIQQISSFGRSETIANPYFEAAVRHNVNRKFYVTAYAKYSLSNYNTDFDVDDNNDGVIDDTIYYEGNQQFLYGIDASYEVNKKLKVHAGADYVYNDYISGYRISDNSAVDSFAEDIIHLKTGYTYFINDSFQINGTINHTIADSYDRTRYAFGVNYSF